MAKITPEDRRRAALEAKSKSRANEQLVTVGSTVESLSGAATESEPAPDAAKVDKQGRGRPTTASKATRNYTFRLTNEESRKIDELVFYGKVKNRSDFIRVALELMCKDN